MRTKGIILGIAVGLVLVIGFSGIFPASAVSNPEDIAAVVNGNNTFAFDLYSVIAKEEGNLFLSPFSVSSALAMTYAGARGETAKQMARALHFDLASAKFHATFSELMKGFNTPGKSYQLSVANALWGQVGTPFLPEFTGITQKFYDAGFKDVDYANHTEQARQTINHWVEEKTNHKIVDLIKPKVLNELTRLVLTNAIYFKGKWERQFKPEHTKPAPFYVSAQQKADVPTMYQSGKFKYAENDQLQILELPYTGGELAMDVLLPKPQSNITKLETSLKLADFKSVLAKLASEKVEVFLPRFKLEKELSLNESLKELGMKDAFDENAADFSGISKTFLYITQVIHKSFVEVNEEGTEAAAATAVIMGTKSVAFDDSDHFPG